MQDLHHPCQQARAELELCYGRFPNSVTSDPVVMALVPCADPPRNVLKWRTIAKRMAQLGSIAIPATMHGCVENAVSVWLDYLQVATGNDTHIAAALQHSGLGIAAGGMVALIAGAAPPLGVAITVLGFGSAGAPYLALAEASGRRKAQEVLREFMGWK